MTGRAPLKAPFPWFGGKSRVSHLVWEAFGDVQNYVEPFAGSLAVLLGRPTPPRIETVNDLDCYVSNFWRAVQLAPDEVARWADWPVNEADLHARHLWLVGREEFRERMKTDPEFYDPKIAGWWVWGICQWIGSGWCSAPQWTGRSKSPRGANTSEHQQRPDLSSGTGRGVHKRLPRKVPLLSGTGPGKGVHSDKAHDDADDELRERDLAKAAGWRKRPALGHSGRGISRQLPSVSGDSGATGRGIHASALHRKLPAIGERGPGRGVLTSKQLPSLAAGDGNGAGIHAQQGADGAIYAWMRELAERLRRVRVCCGDWTRVLGPSVTERIGVTGVFLDPPYSADAERDPSLYSAEDLDVAHAVREWAIENGENPRLRIALCGYEGEHRMPDTWHCVPWKANGGYGSARRDGSNENASRERIWFSPHCLGARQQTLFPVRTA